jgi:hypothetical protein
VLGTLHYAEDAILRTLRAGEQRPPMYDSIGQPISLTPFVVTVRRTDWEAVQPTNYFYWTRFENLLGERFEVRNPPHTFRPAEFRRL